ncbi:hypothetical protein PDJ96_14700 [Bacillus cereus group sp. BY17LC]|uniref:hypothetical protein n=1 Tax=unclassified Bacillus cereus group TaxID=2750818 RepID=UPI0022E8CDE3|nr:MULTISPECIES: hypothetical protein [unclassified Bacillus cereus group]MDA1577273.1 hypothetical protein [Bacillus cereus group sp. TH228LC]MDA1837967.1 hypothetical protein [Bacillus cereus group sp. BY17LC]
MESNPYFHKDVSYQTLSIPTNEVVQKKIRIITVETITIPQQPNELMNEIIEEITEETTDEITDETTDETTEEPTEEPIEEITDEITDKTINKQENNRPDSSPFQINIPYFNIKITSTEILSVAKSVFMQTLLKKISDPVFLMNLMNSEGGKKLLNLAGNFFKDAGTKSENDNDEK